MNHPDESEEEAALHGPMEPGGLLDVLNVASVVLDTQGRIVLWSPWAESLFGYRADEVLGQPADRFMVHERHLDQAAELFADVMRTGEGWAGTFPIRRKDGSTRVVEFRNARLLDRQGNVYGLGLAVDRTTVRRLERKMALSDRVISQSPIGLAVLDTGLRYVSVNPALERINGIPAEDHLGRTVRELLPLENIDEVEAATRRVLETGEPLVDQSVRGHTPADPHEEHAWSVSLHRLEDTFGAVLGVAVSITDVTAQYRASVEAETARRRLTTIADATARIGSTLELDRTAHELASVAAAGLADLASVDLLETVVDGRRTVLDPAEPAVLRTLAVRADAGAGVLPAADPSGGVAPWHPEQLVAQCVRTARPVLVPRVSWADPDRLAGTPGADGAGAGVHSYLAVPLIANGEVLGALGLRRIGNPRPFGEDDLLLARELASRAAVQIDNARWYQRARNTALTLQRSMLPRHPPVTGGLEVASRYQPAESTSEVGGDWFDVIPLENCRTALVVGDVMGSGIAAAASMGRLRTATNTLAALNLDPALLLEHLDRTAAGLDQAIATCLYAVHDPNRRQCLIANAGHLPPVRLRAGCAPELLDLPTGVPLGVGGIGFATTTVDVEPGDRLVFYTDGLVETRQDSLDLRLATLLALLEGPDRPLEEVCDLLLGTLHQPENPDDVALLIARATQPV